MMKQREIMMIRRATDKMDVVEPQDAIPQVIEKVVFDEFVPEKDEK